MGFVYQTFSAPSAVTHIVCNFWFFQTDGTSLTYTHQATATIFPKLVFGLQGSFSITSDGGQHIKLRGCGLNGQTNTFMPMAVQQESVSVFGVVLRPHSLWGITGHPAEILKNEYLDLQSIWSAEGADLEEQVLTAPDHATRIGIISSFLERKWKANIGFQQDSALVHAVHDIFTSPQYLNVHRMAEHFGLSLRQFERKFKKMVGFSAIHFHRISRFEQATTLCLERQLKLTDIAYHLGYFDQAHFIKDFRRFSGLAPSRYQQAAALDIVFTQR